MRCWLVVVSTVYFSPNDHFSSVLCVFIFRFFELQHIDCVSHMNNEQVHSFSLKETDRRRCNYFRCSKFLEIFLLQLSKKKNPNNFQMIIIIHQRSYIKFTNIHLNEDVEIDKKQYFWIETQKLKWKKKNYCNKWFERTQREVLFEKQCVR